MRVEPFNQEHWEAMQLQPAQHWCLPYMSADVVAWLQTLDAYTIFDGDTPVVIAGLFEKWPGAAVAWAYVSEAAGRHMVAITRIVQRFLELKAPRRVEATVDAEFDAGHRWAELLGFEREGLLRANRPDGGDQVIYSRIRNV